MKTNTQLFRKRWTQATLTSLVLAGLILFAMNACKKTESLVQGSKSISPKHADHSTVYTHKDIKKALADVSQDQQGHLVFNNMSHLDAVLYALDSLGDSTAAAWESSISFNSIKLQAAKALTTYSAMGENANSQYTEQDIRNFWTSQANVAIIDENSFEINASDPSLAWVIGNDHLVIVHDIFIYSDYNYLISAPIDNLGNLSTYKTDTTHIDSTNKVAISKLARTTGSSPDVCLSNGSQNLPDITCGSPQQYKSTVQFQVSKVTGYNSSCPPCCHWYVVNNMRVNISNYKRGFLGFWYGQARGSQVYGYFNGVYYNHSLIYGASLVYPSYLVYSATGSCLNVALINSWLSATDCFRNGEVLVAPMCNGATMWDSF